MIDNEGCFKGGGHIDTYTGVVFSLENTTPDMISIRDIAHALSMMCRYCCQCDTFYSVAAHSINASVLAARLYSEARNLYLALLLHDAAEAYIGDITRPMKLLFPGIKELEIKIQHVVNEKFGVVITQQVKDIIKHIDNNLLRWEATQLLPSRANEWSFPNTTIEKEYLFEDLPFPPRQPSYMDAVEHIFLERFNKLISKA